MIRHEENRKHPQTQWKGWEKRYQKYVLAGEWKISSQPLNFFLRKLLLAANVASMIEKQQQKMG